MTSSSILEISNFGLTLKGHMQLKLVESVSLCVADGETVGLVGESGSGKSLTLRAALGLLPPEGKVSGRINFEGENILDMPAQRAREIRRSGMAMIFQNPRAALDPVRTIGHFLTETLIQHDLRSIAEARAEAVKVLSEVGITHPEYRLDQYPHELSGGMLQRVLICAALLSKSKVLLADEPTTALDATTQAELITLLDRMRVEHGLGVIFVTHDLELATAICDRIYVMYAGRVVEELLATDLDTSAVHPYTRALMAARPSIEYRAARLTAIAGKPIGASEVQQGCAFAARCPYAAKKCGTLTPDFIQLNDHHKALCHYAHQIAETTLQVQA